MSDANYILFSDEKGIRQVEKLKTDKRINVIGFTRYSNLITNETQTMNGVYPMITAEVFNELYGKVLTLIDASFPEGAQKDAFKSLVKGSMSDWYDKNTNYTLKMTAQLVDKKEQ